MANGPSTYALHVAGGLVREIWPDEALIEEVIEEDPILGMCTKETDWGYSVVHHPLGWGANQGIGRTAADAKRLKSTASEAEFQLSTREMFAFLSLEGKLLRTFEFTKKKALLVDPVTREGEATIDRMRRRFSKAIHGSGIGVIGRIATTSTINTATITLESGNDLKNFEEGTPLQVEQTGLTGGTLRNNGHEVRVVSIGTEDDPTVTIDVAWNVAYPDLAAGDRLYWTGTYDNDFIYGLDAFLPAYTANNPGTFLTCNRNRNPGWLAGRNVSVKNLTVYQGIQKMARILQDAGQKANVAVISTRRFEKMQFEMENKLQLTKFPAADVGKYKLGVEYGGVEIQGPRGVIKVLPSPWAPDEVDRVGDLSTVVMGSIGPLVHWDTGNGPKDMRTEDGTDNRELRAVSDPAFLVKKPGGWIRGSTTA